MIRWERGSVDGYPAALATVDGYVLEALNGRSAASWALYAGQDVVECGLGCLRMEQAMQEAEEALRRVLRERARGREEEGQA